jgi:xylulokinase
MLLGCGVVRKGDVMIYYGSAGTMMVCTCDLQEVLQHPEALGPNVPYRLGVYAVDSGGFLETLRQELFPRHSFASLDAEAEAVAPGSGGVTVLLSDLADATRQRLPGVPIVGFGPGRTRAELWRASLEAFGYLLANATSIVVDGATVTAAGGGAQTTTWPSIVSDTTGWDQRRASPGGGTRGAGYLAAFGLGYLDAFGDSLEKWATPALSAVVRPDPARHEAYRDALERWWSLARQIGEPVAASSRAPCARR